MKGAGKAPLVEEPVPPDMGRGPDPCGPAKSQAGAGRAGREPAELQARGAVGCSNHGL